MSLVFGSPWSKNMLLFIIIRRMIWIIMSSSSSSSYSSYSSSSSSSSSSSLHPLFWSLWNYCWLFCCICFICNVSLSSATIIVAVLGDKWSLFWEEVMFYKKMLVIVIFLCGTYHSYKCFTQFSTCVSHL